MSFQRSLVKYEEVRFKGITGSKAFSTIVYKSGTVGTGYWYHMVKISYVWNRVKNLSYTCSAPVYTLKPTKPDHLKSYYYPTKSIGTYVLCMGRF